MAAAATAGLPHAQALLAKAIAPHSDSVREVCDAQHPDADAVRRSLLAQLGGRTQWQPRQSAQVQL
jgi:hypothetical protein